MVYRAGEGDNPNDQLRFSEEQIDCCVKLHRYDKAIKVTANIGHT